MITQPSNKDFNGLKTINAYIIKEIEITQHRTERMAATMAEKAVLDTFSLPFGTLHYASADGRNPTRGCH